MSKSHYWFYSILVDIVLVVLGIILSVNEIFMLTMCVWCTMMFYAYSKITSRILLFAFGLTFFVFILGRDFLEQYQIHHIENSFDIEVNEHAYLVYLTGLTSFWLAFKIFSSKTSSQSSNSYIKSYNNSSYIKRIQKYSKFIFFITLPFAFLTMIINIFVVITYGYQAWYIMGDVISSSIPFMYVIEKITVMTIPSFCIFLSTLPTKEQFKKVAKWYVIYITLSLGEGHRGDFLLGIILILIFLIYMQGLRPHETWFKKKYVKLCCLALPIIALGSAFINTIRSGGEWKEINISDSMSDFFYQQGVSGMMVKRTHQMRSNIPEPISGYFTLEFLYSGIPARILGNKVYNGQNIEHALYGNSLTHSLAYAMMGNNYLSGQGTGSSYLAELDYDFGLFGVALGSCLYAFIFSLLSKTRKVSIFYRSIVFIIITYILWAPRASFTSFLALLFSPSIVFLFLFIFGLANLSQSKHKRMKLSNHISYSQIENN